MEALIATAGNLINVLPAPLKALTAEVVSRIKLIRLRAVAVWFTNHSVFSVLSNTSHLQLQWGIWLHHLVHLAFHWALSWKCSQPCILPFYIFHLFFARSMCLCLVVIGFVMFCPFSGLVGCCVGCLVSRGSEHVEYPENNFKLGGNLTEWHSTGLSPGSVPSLAFFLSSFFLTRSMCVCLVVIEIVMLSIFWAGWVAVPNDIPLGSLLEAFPAFHSSFLFLPSSFQQEACIYVWSAVVCGTLRGKWLIYLIEVNE